MPDELKVLVLLAALGLAGLSLVATLAALSSHWSGQSEGIVQLFRTTIALWMGLLYRIAVLVSSPRSRRRAARKRVANQREHVQQDMPDEHHQ